MGLTTNVGTSGMAVDVWVEQWLGKPMVFCEECGRVTASYKRFPFQDGAGGIDYEVVCRECLRVDDE